MAKREAKIYFKENIKFLRKWNYISQDRLAKLIGRKGKTAICAYEKGVCSPPLKTLVMFSKIFRIGIDKMILIRLSSSQMHYSKK